VAQNQGDVKEGGNNLMMKLNGYFKRDGGGLIF
jgi:hypothetical protein